MAFGVFIHRTDSIYDDVPSERYQFPRQYLRAALQTKGDWIIYYEPTKVRDSRGYFAVAKVRDVIADPSRNDMYLAVIEPGTYLDFGSPVAFRTNDTVIEHGVLNDQGRISGRAQLALRLIPASDFARIVDKGLHHDDRALPRTDADMTPPGFSDGAGDFVHLSARDRIAQLANRAVRDRNFRKSVLRAYSERCAITGLRLINGGGRAEVVAAHIRPVEHDGPDIITNGLALSGTAHWMFDRGLVGVSDDLTILVSRQANDPDAVRAMINPTGTLIVPLRPADRPRQQFIAWHRDNCFKH